MRKYRNEIIGCLKFLSFIAVITMAEPIAQLLIR